jgi:hypothetical protein
MIRTQLLCALPAKWAFLAAVLMWFTNEPLGASIVDPADDLGNAVSAEPGAGTDETGSSAPDTAALIRVNPPGDYNGSGLVEQGDLDLVLTSWGRDVATLPTTWTHDRPAAMVDQSALDQVLINWGKAATFSSPVAHMPEPSSLCVATLLLACVGCARAAYKGIERRRSPVA